MHLEISEPREIVVCIAGSLRFYKTMTEFSTLLESRGLTVLTPVPGKYRDPDSPGEYVKGYSAHVPYEEKEREEGKCIRAHIEKVRSSDALYVVNPGGYVGLNTVGEIFCAIENKIPIYVFERITDDRAIGFMSFVEDILEPIDLAAVLNKQKLQITSQMRS